MRSMLWLVAALAILTPGCKKKSRPGPTLPALAGPATVALPVLGHGAAVVSVPVGATGARPVVVAVLGIGDTPEEQCQVWRELVGEQAFVLCPRGEPHWVPDDEDAGAAPAASAAPGASAAPATSATPATRSAEPGAEKILATKPEAGRAHVVGYYPVDLAALEREVSAGQKALKARFAAHVDEHEPLYVGFSRGAFLGASLVARQPGVFRRAVLVEGGQSAWTAASAAAFAKGGGARVLFACGQQSCVAEAEQASAKLREHAVATRVVFGPEGHGYKRQVKDELRKSLAWALEGDARWE